MTKEQNDPHTKIGDLLVSAGLVPSADFTEALVVAKRLKIPVGRVLLAASVITKNVLDSALQAQTMVRRGLSRENAALALELVAERNISFDQARKEMGLR